mmetsp:Transcript_16423/g.62391  ORF Transcript_16423/g.62391 Transcript_16423/m.62391 type:complete len:253 (-) Transcript_16423:491-1249(-)
MPRGSQASSGLLQIALADASRPVHPPRGTSSLRTRIVDPAGHWMRCDRLRGVVRRIFLTQQVLTNYPTDVHDGCAIRALVDGCSGHGKRSTRRQKYAHLRHRGDDGMAQQADKVSVQRAPAFQNKPLIQVEHHFLLGKTGQRAQNLCSYLSAYLVVQRLEIVVSPLYPPDRCATLHATDVLRELLAAAGAAVRRVYQGVVLLHEDAIFFLLVVVFIIGSLIAAFFVVCIQAKSRRLGREHPSSLRSSIGRVA